MKLRKRIRRIPEALLVLIAKGIIPLLSRNAVMRLSRALGGCAYAFSGALRDVAADNLDLVFGDSLTVSEKREINRASFQNFCLVLLDLFWFGRKTHERLAKYVLYDASFRQLFEDPPAIVLTAHIGNWEIINAGCGARGLPMTSIAMPTKNAFADHALTRLREKTGSEITAREGAIRNVIKALKAGRPTLLVVDQNTLPEEGGIFVPFFGVPVPVTKAAGALWNLSHVRIMVSWCIPDEKGYYTVSSKPSFPESGEAPTTEEIAAHVTKELENVIREYPHYWLWSYKRWRFFRESDDRGQYPFYAESYEGYTAYRVLCQRLHAAQNEDEREEASRAVREMEEKTPQRQRRRGKSEIGNRKSEIRKD